MGYLIFKAVTVMMNKIPLGKVSKKKNYGIFHEGGGGRGSGSANFPLRLKTLEIA